MYAVKLILITSFVLFAESSSYYSTYQQSAPGYNTAQNDRTDVDTVMELQIQQLNQYNTCPRFKTVEKDLIIDIQKSQKHGAQLLGAASSESLLECSNHCCDNPSCDLGVYRVHPSSTPSSSSSNHNCYIIKCGDPANCIMAHHSEFTSLLFTATVGDTEDNSGGIGRENSPLRYHGNPVDDSDFDSTKPDSHTNSIDKVLPTQSSMAVPLHTEVQNPIPLHTKVQNPIPLHSKVQNPIPLHSKVQGPIPTNAVIKNVSSADNGNRNTTRNENEDAIQNEHDNATEKPEDIDVSKYRNETKNGNDTMDPSILIVPSVFPSNTTQTPEYHHDNKHLPGDSSKDPCKIHGCNQGSGIIVVAIVGCFAFLVVFFVGIVVIRRLYTNKKKKHYHNVDYLINGMYT